MNNEISIMFTKETVLLQILRLDEMIEIVARLLSVKYSYDYEEMLREVSVIFNFLAETNEKNQEEKLRKLYEIMFAKKLEELEKEEEE